MIRAYKFNVPVPEYAEADEIRGVSRRLTEQGSVQFDIEALTLRVEIDIEDDESILPNVPSIDFAGGYQLAQAQAEIDQELASRGWDASEGWS